MPQEKDGFESNLAYLAAYWKVEKDISTEWYLMAMFAITKVIGDLYVERDRANKEAMELKKQLQDKRESHIQALVPPVLNFGVISDTRRQRTTL